MKRGMAKQYLLQTNCTCVAFDGTNYISSTQRGVAPLLQWLDAGICLEDHGVADKVVGCGAAYLYVRLRARSLYANVISRPALQILQRENCCVEYGLLVEGIQNREGTGPCPMESAVLDAGSEEEAVDRIRQKLRELQK